jgi:hypothetical protein
MEGRASAQAGAPKRFVLMIQPFGTQGEMFFPTAAGPSATFPSQPAVVFRSGGAPLDDPGFKLSPILQPLAPHRNDITVVEGLDNTTIGHSSYGTVATGGSINGGPSVDQALAPLIGKTTKYPSLQFGCASTIGAGPECIVSWYGPGKGAPPENNPQTMFARLFSDVRTDPKAAGNLLAQRRSILDAAIGQATALRARLGADDRAKLEQYFTSMRDVERLLSAAAAPRGGQGCKPPAEPGQSKGYWTSENNMAAAVAAQSQLLLLALACDLTRVATFQISADTANPAFPFLGVNSRWHDLSHARNSPEFTKVNVWYATQVAALITRLKEMDLFAGTVVLWLSHMQNGAVHDSHNLPVVVAGGLGGVFRTGRHLRVASRYVNDLHVSLLQGFGGSQTSFGSAGMNKGPIPGLLSR